MAFDGALRGGVSDNFGGPLSPLIHALSGTIAGTSALTGALSVVRVSSGQVSGAGAVAADLDRGLKVGGAEVGAGTLEAAAHRGLALAGTIGATSSLAGALSISRTSAGVVAGVGAGTADLDRELGVGGVGSGQGALQGGVQTSRALAGTVAASAELSGALSYTRGLVGELAAAGALAGDLLIDPPQLEDFVSTLEVVVHVGAIAFNDNTATVEIPERDATVAIDSYIATLEVDDMSYTIKAGDRIPGIAGRITVPYGIDLTDVDLFLTYKGRRVAARTIQVDNDGLHADSPALDNDAEASTIWRWSHAWADGETVEPDVYQVGISASISGLQISFPNAEWAKFVILAQLTASPVPA